MRRTVRSILLATLLAPAPLALAATDDGARRPVPPPAAVEPAYKQFCRDKPTTCRGDYSVDRHRFLMYRHQEIVKRFRRSQHLRLLFEKGKVRR